MKMKMDLLLKKIFYDRREKGDDFCKVWKKKINFAPTLKKKEKKKINL